MSVLERAGRIGVNGDATLLDRIARQLHGKPYRLLSDEEAGLVWSEIEKGQGNES